MNLDVQRTTLGDQPKTPECAQILQLLQRIGTKHGVDTFKNPNGEVAVASCVRETGAVRIYVEGLASTAMCERAILAALKSILGGQS